MYAMRYGTIPIVRRTGGLQDTVVDIGDPGGYGITHAHASVGDITHGIFRAVELYGDPERMKQTRKKVMKLDFSWNRSAKQYLELYRTLK
jgi:starch synthase